MKSIPHFEHLKLTEMYISQYDLETLLKFFDPLDTNAGMTGSDDGQRSEIKLSIHDCLFGDNPNVYYTFNIPDATELPSADAVHYLTNQISRVDRVIQQIERWEEEEEESESS